MHERGAPVTGVCQHYGISRKTFYKWFRRYKEGGRDFHVLNDRSPQTPRPSQGCSQSYGGASPGPAPPHPLRPPGVWPTTWPKRVNTSASLAPTGCCNGRAWRRSAAPDPTRSPRATPWPSPAKRVQVDVKYLPSLRLRDRPEPFKQYLYTAIDDCTRLQVARVSNELTPPRQLSDSLRV